MHFFLLSPSAIDIDEFLGMYKRLFIQCRAVVASDMKDILPESPQSHTSPSIADSSSKSSSGRKVSFIRELPQIKILKFIRKNTTNYTFFVIYVFVNLILI